MLQFKQDDTDVKIILTLTENVTLDVPYYLFVFTHVLTKDVVAFVKSIADDESGFPARYNQFSVNPGVVFAGTQPGHWHYKVYEQESAVNINPAQAGGILEYGKLIIDRAVEFAFTQYHSPTTYKTYNG